MATYVYNPIHSTMWLPDDVKLDDIDWSTPQNKTRRKNPLERPSPPVHQPHPHRSALHIETQAGINPIGSLGEDVPKALRTCPAAW